MYVPQLTFTRFIAASCIVFFHFGNSIYPFNSQYLSNVVMNADVAVSFFFFLSGMVLTLSYWEKEKFSARLFVKKRLARIYPLYILASLLTLTILMTHSSLFWDEIVSEILMIQAWNPEVVLKINYPSWSISAELFFYCLFPFLIVFLQKKTFSFMLIFTLGIWGVCRYWEFFVERDLFYFFENAQNVTNFIILFPLFHFLD